MPVLPDTRRPLWHFAPMRQVVTGETISPPEYSAAPKEHAHEASQDGSLPPLRGPDRGGQVKPHRAKREPGIFFLEEEAAAQDTENCVTFTSTKETPRRTGLPGETPLRNRKGQWCSVKDSMPGTLERVLAFDDGLICIGVLYPDGWYEDSTVEQAPSTINPTHWMPLPDPPGSARDIPGYDELIEDICSGRRNK